MTKAKHDRILLAHGGGGQLTDELIRHHILPNFKNNTLTELADSAKLNLASKSVYFTTDSYVVKPLFFNGGDIGKLAVCGTVNDLAVAGSKPIALSLSLIIEEGFEFESLDKILASISEAARQNNVNIVTGDSKTVETGAADKIFINTAGIGEEDCSRRQNHYQRHDWRPRHDYYLAAGRYQISIDTAKRLCGSGRINLPTAGEYKRREVYARPNPRRISCNTQRNLKSKRPEYRNSRVRPPRQSNSASGSRYAWF
jgi:hypothetical protein